MYFINLHLYFRRFSQRRELKDQKVHTNIVYFNDNILLFRMIKILAGQVHVTSCKCQHFPPATAHLPCIAATLPNPGM